MGPTTPKEPELGASQAGAAPAREALLVFFGLTSLLMTALAIAMGLRPQWFGLGEPASGRDPQSLVPSASGVGPFPERGDASSVDGKRDPVARVPASPTLHQVLFADAMRSVVHVTTLATGTGDIATPTTPVETDFSEYVKGTGSGLIWDSAGHIVTCKHVLDNVDGATVTLYDGTKWSAKFVGVDDRIDLAIVRIAAPVDVLTPIRLGTSSDLTVGMTALSVASPFGLGHSLSVGYVSGLGRRIRSTTGRILTDTIQTDAAIHRGSSGGALIDDQGRVVGLNAAVHSESERAVGVGFALPMDQVRARVPEIIASGYRWYPALGLTVSSDAASAQRLASLPKDLGGPRRGILVAQVDEGSLAAMAGLRDLQSFKSTAGAESVVVRDIIVGVNDVIPAGRVDLDEAIGALSSGDTVRLRVARRAGEVEVVLRHP